MSTPDEVISWWFGEAPGAPRHEIWFGRDDAVDAEIRARFGDDVERARRGELGAWTGSARGALALILLLDQMSRNLHRGSPEAFAADPLAQRVCLEAVEAGLDGALPPVMRGFLYMPLMHAEDRGLQERGVELFRRLAEESLEASSFHHHAVEHKKVVDRFGRYPHRNAVLGRASTPEEAAFLLEHTGW